MFLGDAIIERAPHIRWTFFTQGTRDLAFQRHVLMGFTRVSNPKYNVDIDLLVAQYGHRVVAGDSFPEDAFMSWVNGAVEKA